MAVPAYPGSNRIIPNTMSSNILVFFGVGLIVIGVATIREPQRVHNLGSARQRYEDGELSDFGQLQLRLVGVFSTLVGMAFLIMGVI